MDIGEIESMIRSRIGRRASIRTSKGACALVEVISVDEEGFTYHLMEPGQDYAMARYYSATSGSFWSQDPGGVKTANPSTPTSWNRIAYAYADPINHTDYSGTIVDAGDCINDPDECTECLPGASFWGLPPGCESQGGGGDDDEDDETDQSSGSSCLTGLSQLDINYVTQNVDAAFDLSVGTGYGLSAAFILSWAAVESAFGTRMWL